MMTEFEILGELEDIETVAAGRDAHIRRYLERTYDKGRWCKMKGIVTVRLADDTVCDAEIHWFEAHGVRWHDGKIGHNEAFASGALGCYPLIRRTENVHGSGTRFD